MRFRHALQACCVFAVLGFVGEAAASGFALKEQSSTAQGNAFAGASAGADDISYSFFNPAALVRHGGIQVKTDASYIVPTRKASGATASTVTGATIEGSASGSDIAENAVIPALYGSWEVNDQWHLGMAFNVPFGLTTDNGKDFVGRYHGTRSMLQTMTATPMVAWRPIKELAVGGGLQVEYAKAKLEAAVDFGTVDATSLGGALGGTPGSLADDGQSAIKGDDWSTGFTAGVLYMPTERTRFGAAYRSGIVHKLVGTADFDHGTGVGAGVSANTGLFVDTGAQAKLNLPAQASIGAYHDLNDEWAVMGEVAWTDWSTFEYLIIEFDNNQPNSVTPEKWQDTMFYALGATYKPKDTGLTVRMGVAYDESPIKEGYRTPRIPGGDRVWASGGLGYRLTDSIDLSASFTHIWVRDGTVSLEATSTNENKGRGNLTAPYGGDIDIFTVSARFAF